MIHSEAQLRQLYAAPAERALRKQLSMLDSHCQRFISLSPFCVLATGGGEGAAFTERFATATFLPKVVIELQVHEAYLHCAKSLMRSKLWDVEQQVPRDVLPSMNAMIHDQIGAPVPTESQQEMLARYVQQLADEQGSHRR